MSLYIILPLACSALMHATLTGRVLVTRCGGLKKLGSIWVPFIEFLHLNRSPDTFCWFLGGIFVSVALLFDPILEFVAEDVTVKNCLDLVVLLIIHNHWQWRRGLLASLGLDW